jgi:ATP adenylyltransferase
MDYIDSTGMPDAWSRLWAPHRLDYLRGENRPLAGNEITCPFCEIPSMSDEEGLVVHRGSHAYVVMNLYPYNPGHLLICAYRHVADLTELTDEEREEIFALTSHAMSTIRKVSQPEGFNLGMNRFQEPAWRRTFTNMWFRVGQEMRTLCQSSARQRYCRSC